MTKYMVYCGIKLADTYCISCDFPIYIVWFMHYLTSPYIMQHYHWSSYHNLFQPAMDCSVIEKYISTRKFQNIIKLVLPDVCI